MKSLHLFFSEFSLFVVVNFQYGKQLYLVREIYESLFYL